ARAAPPQLHGGPYWIMVHAGGGWDPTFLCDPKAGNANFNAATQAVGTAGGISYSANTADPVALLGAPADQVAQYAPYFLSNEVFFGRHGSALTVFNGIDTGTNNHDTGMRNTWSGQNDGYPALAAVIAGTYGANQPLAFVSNGGYDATFDLVALSRISSGDSIAQLARPNLTNAMDPNSFIQLPAAYGRIQAAQAARIARQQARATMVREQRGLNALALARDGAGALADVVLPSTNLTLPNGLGDQQRLCQQAQLVISTFKAGVAVAASLELGGFDTHGDHDDSQARQLAKLLGGVDFILAELERQGLRDKTYVLVGSEFGRGPRYNSARGKDHWPVTSMLAFGPKIPGNRVIGATDAEQQPLKINPTTLLPDSAGVSLTPTAINKALRVVSGTAGSEADERYPLPGTALPLFG
ncbi:MAG TPA: DUF1501 domain-containing protein, partial [Myxococcota bacterium]|nr:DUF1501 domain-containing protein [Myxococcota bacterium]